MLIIMETSSFEIYSFFAGFSYYSFYRISYLPENKKVPKAG